MTRSKNMRKPFFNEGEVVQHKSDSPHKIVILKTKRKLFGQQKYRVSWWDDRGYHNSCAFECELLKSNK